MADFFSRAALAGARVRSDVRNVNQVASWISEGRQFLSAQRLRSRKSGVRVSKKITETALGLMARAAPAVAGAFTETLVPVAVRAFNQWPIKSGESKSKLLLEFRVLSETRFSARINNRAKYSAVINRGATAQELIFKPGRLAASTSAKLIARAVAKG